MRVRGSETENKRVSEQVNEVSECKMKRKRASKAIRPLKKLPLAFFLQCSAGGRQQGAPTDLELAVKHAPPQGTCAQVGAERLYLNASVKEIGLKLYSNLNI